MSKYLFTEAQVKEALQINSFREISKAKLMEFVSLIPSMDKEVALAIIDQFPSYTASAKVMVEQLNTMCTGLLAENKDSRNSYVAAYKSALDSLQELLKRDDLSAEDRKYITKQMLSIADKLADKDTENKQFLSGMLKYGFSLLGLIIVVSGAILGVNVKGSHLPSLSKAA